jgi:protein-L-isoaspartate(D-aspartate) O-methyltransferase
MEEIRRKFAERVANAATLESDALRAAFAAVRREDFVGPGPWQIMRSADISEGYEQTPDANPVHLYDLVTVALDPERLLNNGEPASVRPHNRYYA